MVGDRVRAVREAADLRQQDLSDAARALGLGTWNRSLIAALERGDKAISAEDLVRLVAVLTAATRRAVDIAELLDSPARISLSDIASIAARGVAAVLRGADADLHVERVKTHQNVPGLDTPERQRAAQRSGAIRYAAGRRKPLTVGEQNAVREGFGEADERARRELGEDDYPFETLCAVLWGRSLSTERDSRLAASGGNQGSAASVAARRGRITRELLTEARNLLTRADELER